MGTRHGESDAGNLGLTMSARVLAVVVAVERDHRQSWVPMEMMMVTKVSLAGAGVHCHGVGS